MAMCMSASTKRGKVPRKGTRELIRRDNGSKGSPGKNTSDYIKRGNDDMNLDRDGI